MKALNMTKIVGKWMAPSGYTWMNLNKKEVSGAEDEIVVTNKQLLAQAKRQVGDWMLLRREERIRNYPKYQKYFRSIEGLTPLPDLTGNGAMPVAYEDDHGNLYDYIYDASTFELIPLSAFGCEQLRVNFVAVPAGTKTLKSLTVFDSLRLLRRYNESLYYENDYAMDSPEYQEVEEKLGNLQRGILPPITGIREELVTVAVRVDMNQKSLLLEFTAEAGERLMHLNQADTLFGNPNSILAFIVPADELLEMAQNPNEVPSYKLLKRIEYYGMRMGYSEGTQRFAFIISKADLLKTENNIHIQKVLDKNTIYRDGNGKLALGAGDKLDVKEMKWMQAELWMYLKETNEELYNKLLRIQTLFPVDLFLNADLNTVVAGDSFDPEKITPYRTDEFLKSLLYQKGLLQAVSQEKTEDAAEEVQRTKSVMHKARELFHTFGGGKVE